MEESKEKFTIDEVKVLLESLALKQRPREEMLYTVKEAAEILKTSVNKLYEYQHAGIIKFLKLGTTKVTKKELERFVNKYEGMDITDPYNIKELEPVKK